jgi:D-beta-D-heptose 7-phosphate kinase/D-beta-D-heptose 1-phosphate adenosyltransferase
MDFSGMKALVIGDCCLDIIESGTSTRLAPESPVPVILNTSKTYKLGMAGNVASNLKSLGAEVYLSSYIGKDKYGSKVREIMINEGIIELLVNPDFKTNLTTIVKKRLFANGHQVARLDREEYFHDNISAKYYKEVLDKLTKNSKDFFDLVVISDYNKGLINILSTDYINYIIEYVNKGEIFVDTKKADVLKYFSNTILFPNTLEMKKILNHNSCISEHELIRKLNCDFIIETASEYGAYLYDRNRYGSYHSNTEVKNAVDVYGCGDTFIAAFSLFYTKFKNKGKSLEFANYCASKAALVKGLHSVNINEVIDFSRGWDK